jgi:predicted transcriptional regulator
MAAKTVRPSSMMFRLLEQFAKKSQTSEEAATGANLLHTGYWKRASDLANQGWIEERRKPGGSIFTTMNRSGRQAIVWKITPSGRTALREYKAAKKALAKAS